MSLERDIRRYIEQNMLSGGQPALESHDSLIERGVIDSMGLMQLMAYLEEHTGVRIPDSEVTLENFETVTNIERLVSRLRRRD